MSKIKGVEKSADIEEKPLTKEEIATNKILIPRLISIVEMTYASFGYQVKVVEVHIHDKNYIFGIAITMGTKIDEIISLDKELALALESPGKVEIRQMPGRDLLYIDVPKGKKIIAKGKYKILRIPVKGKMETGQLADSEFYEDIKSLLRFSLTKAGDLFYWLEKKVPRKKIY